MLPFDRRPWAKHLAATVIVLTLIGAVCVPIILHQRKALDPPVIVGVILLLLAIIPPNIVILRRRNTEDNSQSPSSRPHLYAPRHAGR